MEILGGKQSTRSNCADLGVARALEAQDISDSDNQEGCKQNGSEEEDGDKTHESRHALRQFDHLLGQFGLIGGLFLNGFLQGGEFVFEATEGAFLLAGVERKGALVRL